MEGDPGLKSLPLLRLFIALQESIIKINGERKLGYQPFRDPAARTCNDMKSVFQGTIFMGWDLARGNAGFHRRVARQQYSICLS